jgi:hypothetical protein
LLKELAVEIWHERPDDMIRRIRGEFLEMPGLTLTVPQAQRLWGLDPAFCHNLLNALVDAGFLVRTHEGAFVHHDSNSPLA